MSAHTFAIVSALVASAIAQSTSVTSMILPGFEGQNVVASVMTVAPGATTYFVGCAPGTDSSDCGFGLGFTIVEGPSTFGAHYTEQDAFTMDLGCSISGQDATCTETAAGSEANDPGTSTAVLSSISDSVLPVTITAGLELLSGGGTTSAEASSATGTDSASSSSASPASASTSSGAKATGSTTSTSSTATGTSASTAGVPRMTQNAVIAGVAALVGGAVVLL